MKTPPSSTPTERWAFEELQELERKLQAALERIAALEAMLAQSTT